MKQHKRVAYLTEDATHYRDSIQLHYRRRGMSGGFSGPPAKVCPPVEKLKKGTKVYLYFDYPWGGDVIKVKLAERIENMETAGSPPGRKGEKWN